MRDPLFRPLASFSSSRDSVLQRIGENLQQILAPIHISPSSANSAPLHLLPGRRGFIANGSRTASFLVHALLVAGLLFLQVRSGPPKRVNDGPEPRRPGPLTFFPMAEHSLFGEPSLGLKSGGGENDPRPTRHGDLAPESSRPLLPPRRTVNLTPELPVPVAVFDPKASQQVPSITNLGLPWLKDNSDSAGPGKDHGFGSGKKGGMGDDEGPGAGQGESYSRSYTNLVTPPSCAYCPDPQYTDEAREAKLQGKVTLQVLIGAEGRATQVRIVQGIGMGLDERAAQSVRGWKFIPAHDAARRAVPVWVTIEVVFRLI